MEALADDLDYWEVRELLRMAALANDLALLQEISAKYPGIFQNALNQAKNDRKAVH